MRLRRPAHRPERDLGLIPMINVVLLLLIFFMLLGRVESLGPLPVDAPRSSSAAGSGGSGELLIQLSANNELAVGAERVAWEQLATTLTTALAEPRAVTVMADATVEAAQLLALLAALREAGAGEIALLTVRE